MILDFGKIVVDIDIAATADYYHHLPIFQPDYIYNENYLQAVQSITSNDMHSIASLGIDLRKVARASFLNATDVHSVYYDCTSFVSGRMIKMESQDAIIPPAYYKGVALCIQANGFYPTDQPLPISPLQIGYQLCLPWVLTERPVKMWYE